MEVHSDNGSNETTKHAFTSKRQQGNVLDGGTTMYVVRDSICIGHRGLGLACHLTGFRLRIPCRHNIFHLVQSAADLILNRCGALVATVRRHIKRLGCGRFNDKKSRAIIWSE
jgi:hypothetical protein